MDAPELAIDARLVRRMADIESGDEVEVFLGNPEAEQMRYRIALSPEEDPVPIDDAHTWHRGRAVRPAAALETDAQLFEGSLDMAGRSVIGKDAEKACFLGSIEHSVRGDIDCLAAWIEDTFVQIAVGNAVAYAHKLHVLASCQPSAPPQAPSRLF